MWAVAEQLLGAGTVAPCIGEDAAGMTDGPCYISDDSVENLMSHMGAPQSMVPPLPFC